MILAMDDRVFMPGSYLWCAGAPQKIGEEALVRLPETFGRRPEYATVMMMSDGYLTCPYEFAE